MKKYRFIFGLMLSLLSSAWLISLARLPMPELSAKRGGVAIAAILFFVGIGLILFDTLTRNPRLEKLEEQRRVLREEIYAMLPDVDESQQELNIYINETFGKTGISGLDLNELNRVKKSIQLKGDERLKDKV